MKHFYQTNHETYQSWWLSLNKETQQLIIKHNKKLKKRIQVQITADYVKLDYSTLKTLRASYCDYLDKEISKTKNKRNIYKLRLIQSNLPI